MLGAGARRGKRVAFQDESNKRTAAEMSMQTPLTKAKRVKDTLKSPSRSTSAHT